MAVPHDASGPSTSDPVQNTITLRDSRPASLLASGRPITASNNLDGVLRLAVLQGSGSRQADCCLVADAEQARAEFVEVTPGALMGEECRAGHEVVRAGIAPLEKGHERRVVSLTERPTDELRIGRSLGLRVTEVRSPPVEELAR